ncbi:MAG: ribosomal biogenesis protein [Spirochaetia bacterium]|nr:ribosomal biogenesis protein [Spirochaetia bacterium]
MNITVKGVHYNPSDETKEFLNKKLEKINFADSSIQDLEIVMLREKVGQGFHVDAHMHFNWGTRKTIGLDCYELYEGIELIVDKISTAARREKGKVKNHKKERLEIEPDIDLDIDSDKN